MFTQEQPVHSHIIVPTFMSIILVCLLLTVFKVRVKDEPRENFGHLGVVSTVKHIYSKLPPKESTVFETPAGIFKVPKILNIKGDTAVIKTNDNGREFVCFTSVEGCIAFKQVF